MDLIIKVSNNDAINWFNNYAYTMLNTYRCSYIPIYECFRVFPVFMDELSELPVYENNHSSQLQLMEYKYSSDKLIKDINEIVGHIGLIKFEPKVELLLSYGVEEVEWTFYVQEEKVRKQIFNGFLGNRLINFNKLEGKFKYLEYNDHCMLEMPASKYTFGIYYRKETVLSIPHRALFFKLFNEMKNISTDNYSVLFPIMDVEISRDMTKAIMKKPEDKTNYYLHHKFIVNNKNNFSLDTEVDFFTNDAIENAINITINNPFIWYTRHKDVIISMGIFS